MVTTPNDYHGTWQMAWPYALRSYPDERAEMATAREIFKPHEYRILV